MKILSTLSYLSPASRPATHDLSAPSVPGTFAGMSSLPSQNRKPPVDADGEPSQDEQSVKRPRLTESDVPPLPAKLGKNATDAEKGARAEQMKARRHVQMQLQEKNRAARDRVDRVRPFAEEESRRRAAQRLLASASRSLRPLAATFTTLFGHSG